MDSNVLLADNYRRYAALISQKATAAQGSCRAKRSKRVSMSRAI